MPVGGECHVRRELCSCSWYFAEVTCRAESGCVCEEASVCLCAMKSKVLELDSKPLQRLSLQLQFGLCYCFESFSQ